MTLALKSKTELIKEITKLKKQLEKPTSVRTEKLRSEIDLKVYDNLPLPYILFDDKKIIYFNKKAAQVLKYNKQQNKETGTKSIYDFVLPEHHKILKQLISGKEVKGLELKIKNNKGAPFFIELQCKAVLHQGKKVQQAIFREITQHRQLIHQLEKSKNNLDLILHNIDEIVYYYDSINKQVLYISAQIEKVLGISTKAYIKNPNIVIKQCHPDDLKNIYETVHKIRTTKRTCTFIYRVKNFKTNKYVWIEERIFPQYNTKNEYIGSLGVSRDITKEKENELKIKESEAKFRLLAENANDIVFHYSFEPEPVYTYVSPSVTKILGYSPQDFYDDPFFGYKILHPEDEHLLRESESRIKKRTGTKINADYLTIRYITKDKKTIWIETRFTEIKKGRKMIALEGISRDISREKENEFKLKESEKKFRLLAENANDIVFRYSFNPKPSYTYVSPSVQKILGYKPENFYKDPSFINKIAYPEDADLILDFSRSKAFFKRRAHFPDVHIIRFFTKKKNIVWLETRYSPVWNDKGDILEIQGISRDISLQKQNEIALFESERTLSNLFSNLPGMAYRCYNDSKWTMSFISMGCIDLTGYRPNDFIGNKKIAYSDIIHPEDKGLETKKVNEAIKKELVFEIEYRIVTKEKKIKWVLEKGEGIYHNKELLYIEGFITDITQRKLFEKEINQQWSNYKAVIDHSPNGILIYQNGKIIFSNPAALRIVGYNTQEELLKISLLDILLPEYKSIGRERIKKAIAGETIPPQQYKIKTAKNEILEVEVKSTLIVFNGSPALQVIINDLTAQKQLERETIRAQVAEETNKKLEREIEHRKQTEYQLQQTQNYLRLIIDSSLDMICASNKEGLITEFNLAAQKTFGYTPEEIMGKPTSTLFANPDDRNTVYGNLISDDFYFSGEVINRKKNGETFISLLSASALKNEQGEIIGSMGVSRDITITKKNEEEILHQSAKLKAIFESPSHLIWTVNRNLELTSFNKIFADVVQDKFKVYPQLNKTMGSLLPPEKVEEYTAYWNPIYSQVLQGKNLKIERRDYNGKGDILYREIFLQPIVNEKNQVVEVSCIAHDVTENKNYEKQITEQSAKLKAIFESGNQMMWSVNKEMALTSFNKNYSDSIYELYRIFPELGKAVNRPEHWITTKEYRDFWVGKYEKVFEGESLQFVTERANLEGKKRLRQVYLHPIFDETKKVIEVSGIAYDITELRYYEQETLKQSAKLKAIFDSGSHMIWSIDKNFSITSSNENFNKVFQLYTGDSTEKLFEKTDPENRKEKTEKYLSAFKGLSQHFEVKLQDEKNNTQWAEIFLEPVFDEKGSVYEVSGIAHNITQRKIAEEQIRQSLKEKEVLLKEVHHRVKNNLQVISSILNLQSTYVRDNYTLNLLKECQNRIKSMAFIHESLYQTKDFSEINFSEYIILLVKNLIHSYNTYDNRIKTRFEVENLFLNLDTSIPCGLIVNELVSNALKYAFPENYEGHIFVQLKTKDDMVILSISDNGIGLPRDIDYRNTESLGLQLVVTLVEQISGEMELNTDKGTNFTIKFKLR